MNVITDCSLELTAEELVKTEADESKVVSKVTRGRSLEEIASEASLKK